ncbi:MAG: dihydroxyacetone kinase subunit L [Oscillospiraceae bacterium]
MLTRKEIEQMFLSVGENFQASGEMLSEIDSRFGDGDHGITINKIGMLIENSVKGWQQESISEFIEKLGDGIMGINGGSAGPLYGTMIGGLALPIGDKTEIDKDLLKAMLASSLAEMQDITTAKVGDKTMMDALIPAVEAAQKCEGSVGDILKQAEKAAHQGAENSKNFASKFGRAKSYKDQTIGTPDAGAISTTLFFNGLAKPF